MNTLFKTIIIFMLMVQNCWGGVDFDGDDDYIDLNTQSIGSGSTLSISLWINPDAVTADTGGDSRAPIVNRWKNDTNDRGFQFRLGTTSETFRFAASSDGSANDGADFSLNATVGSWQSVVLVYNAGSLSLFVDGIKDTTSITITSIFSASTNVDIGRAMNGGVWDYYGGDIDEVAIWNSALTDRQASILSTSRVRRTACQIDPSNLDGLWALDDISDGENADTKSFKCVCGVNCSDGTGEDGSNDGTLLGKAGENLSYP